jgi:hypothetical protein
MHGLMREGRDAVFLFSTLPAVLYAGVSGTSNNNARSSGRWVGVSFFYNTQQINLANSRYLKSSRSGCSA